MASVVISGDTSGAVTITAPAVAGTPTLTLPTTTGTLATLTTPSFGTTIGVGGATASASGSGISFPATQSASSDANTLDDYEEGTWTPVVSSSGGGTGTYSTQTGTYTKVGNVVYVWFRVAITNHSGSGTMDVGGLPFTSSSTSNLFGAASVNFVDLLTFTASNYLACYVSNNSTTLLLRQIPIGGANVSSATINLDTSFGIIASAYYTV